MQYSALLLIPMLCAGIAYVQADTIYRWTDENGQVHFSSRPPQEQMQNAERVQLKIPRATPAAEPRAVTPTPPPPAQEVTQTAPAISAEQAAAHCRQAREQKQVLAENFNRRFLMPDGESRPLTDAERAAQNKVADDLIRQYCR